MIIMVRPTTKPLLEAKTQNEFDRKLKTLLGTPEDRRFLGK